MNRDYSTRQEARPAPGQSRGPAAMTATEAERAHGPGWRAASLLSTLSLSPLGWLLPGRPLVGCDPKLSEQRAALAGPSEPRKDAALAMAAPGGNGAAST